MAIVQCGVARFEHVQAILFDKDGTLADSHTFLRSLGQKRARLIDAQIPGVQDPLLMAFGLSGDQLNPAGLLAVGTRLENEIAAAAYVAETGRDWMESLAIVRSHFTEADKILGRKADSTPMFEGALESLQRLTNAGIKIGIVSSDTTENVQDFVERYQLYAWVQFAIGSDARLSKPNPELFRYACEKLAVTPDVTLAIGDSTSDIEMAHAAQAIACVGVTWGWTQPIHLKQADSVINHFNDIQIL